MILSTNEVDFYRTLTRELAFWVRNFDFVHQILTAMPASPRCPSCDFSRSWKLRRSARRCKRCRKEWVPDRWLVKTICVARVGWAKLIAAFLRYRTLKAVRQHVPHSEYLVLRMVRAVRLVMENDVPKLLSGTVEVDETYIAGQWRNARWSIRKHGSKRGRGTKKQAVFGIRERNRGLVRAFLVPNARKSTLFPIMRSAIAQGSTIYSDAFQVYRHLAREGFQHDFVDHNQGEYGRGKVHSNGIEGFWGWLKRRLKITGGIRRDRLHLYVAEEVWRYNNRKLPEEQQINRLIELLREKFGG